MSNLARFLIRVSSDPKELAKFKLSPYAAMKRARLNSRERKAILSKDPARIREVMGVVFWGPDERTSGAARSADR
jgi:hypothetical protein